MNDPRPLDFPDALFSQGLWKLRLWGVILKLC